MHARIKFHAYSDIKVYTETVSHKKEKDYQRFTLNPGNEGSKHHRQSTGGCVRLAPATSSQGFRSTSSFWATLFIARVSTCRTEQVWRKIWMQRLYSGLGYKHLSNFSWSNFISTTLLIKYKFIPTHSYHKEIDKIRHKHMASITREHDLSPSSSLVIMWGSRPLLTMSTANQLVLHSTEVAHLYPQVA
jgi:hypothetical protein